METNEKLLSVVFNVGRMIREKIHSSNCLNDFTHSEFEVLKFVQDKKNTTMKSIAGHLHIKPPSVTPVIDNLVEKGNLKRVQKADDRRIVYISLTRKGLKSLQEKYKNIHNTIRKVFGKLSDKDKKDLIKIFEKIHAENI